MNCYLLFVVFYVTFTDLEKIVVLNVIQDNMELKINWEKSVKQPVEFHKVGIFFIWCFFFLVFDFLIFK